VLLAELLYQPGVYDSGPIPLPPGAAARHNSVCALSTGAPIDVSGVVVYSTEGGSNWQEWTPFGMTLGDSVFDNKRNQWVHVPSHRSSSSLLLR
jgi:hypothetical protein